jgi:hypothetical protein
MIDDSKVAKDNTNGLEPAAPRILARQLARPLTDDEIDFIAGGMISLGAIGVERVAARADTNSCTGCPTNDCDC